MIATTVYTLSESDTGAVRYVGATRMLLCQRIGNHLHQAKKRNHPVCIWLRSLKTRPVIQALLVVEDDEADEMERRVIALYRQQGVALVNRMTGGRVGARHAPETKELVRAATTGVQFTAERLANMSAAKIGKKYSPLQRQSLDQRKQAKTHCVNGHQYTSETLVLDKFGWRHCRICRNQQARKSQMRGRVS